jgi:DNA-binding IscR family transcriptional regulator
MDRHGLHREQGEDQVNDVILAVAAVLEVAKYQRDLLRAPDQEPQIKKKKLRSPTRRPAPTHVIAERLTGNKRGLEQMMPKLAACGIVKGIRGPCGGHRLARGESEITLRQVCEAVAKPDFDEVVDPWSNDIPSCVQWIVNLAQHAKMKFLENWTLERVLDEIERRETAKNSTPQIPTDAYASETEND